MKVPFSWLTELCDPGLAPEEVAELLSMRAVEVERVTRIGAPDPAGFVVGKVISAEPHPNADRLRVCEVDTGDTVRTIVCGAPNVAAEQWVAVVLPGARMPGGEKLGEAKLRGVESHGMILSERELELSDEHEGIYVLSASSASRPGAAGSGAELAPGMPLEDLWPISDAVLELDLNPNRVDCLGVYGVAREVHAITGAPLAPAPWRDDAAVSGAGEVSDLASVRIEVPELCPRFTARAFTDVAIGPSPAWLKARLAAAGQRPISNVVDITNYVMLLTAQPLHAFDLDRVPGGELIVRSARAGETMTTLDGVERSFDSETVLVCDRERPIGVAGIMGGQVSEVSAQTTRVLLEVATWNGDNILRSSARLGLRSEASTRFEKQLHPEIAIHAQRVASRLLADLAGAGVVAGMIDEAAEVPAAHVIGLSGSRLESVLGVAIGREDAAGHLGRLGFETESTGDGELAVTVPLHRHYDVTREIDLVEEVGRLHGFDRLPRTLPASAQRIGGLSREQRGRRRAEDLLRDLGFDEAVTWSLVSPELADRLRLAEDDPRRRAITVANPISAEQSQLRTTLLGGLLAAARHNLARGAERVALFESGSVYLPEPAPARGGRFAGEFVGKQPAPAGEPHRLGGLIVGSPTPRAWTDPATSGRDAKDQGRFFALKGILELLAAAFDAPAVLSPAAESFLHPGRAASVEIGGGRVGWIGEIHPLLARDWDVPGASAFEIDLAPLLASSKAGAETYADLTTFPAVLQDLAVIVAERVPAELVRAAIREGGGELLSAAEVFDVYRGDQLASGEKSLALRLEFRAGDRTLTDDEVASLRERIESALSAIGGSLRD